MINGLLSAVGWSKRQGVVFFVGVLAFIILPALLGRFGADVGNVILWLTGVVVLLYTAETQGLRLEMVRQNEMAIQPLVIATIEARTEQRTAPTSVNRLILKNIGRGTALYVKVKEIGFEKVMGGYLMARFENVDYIEPGKDAAIDAMWRGEFEGEDPSTSRDFTANLDPRVAQKTYDVIILYEDISGKQHKSVVRMGKGGVRLLKPRSN